MFNNYSYNPMPNGIQPYWYAMPTYPQQLNSTLTQPYTNLIYVSGIEDVRTRTVPIGSTMIFADNDRPLIYKKTVDNKGQFEVETFDIIPHKNEEPKSDQTNFVIRSEFNNLQNKINAIEQTLSTLKKAEGGSLNGTESSTTNNI